VRFNHLKRREFITLLGGAAAWPLAAQAQQPAIPAIGFLHMGSPQASRGIVFEFRDGLKEAGYIEGKNVAIEFRWANDQPGLSEMAADLVRRKVNLIVTSGASGSLFAAKAATSTIPIVFEGGIDPVKYGLVASLQRPGGNVTGVTAIHNQLAGKRLDLLIKLLPQVMTTAYLVGFQNNETEQGYTNDLLAAARLLGREVIVLECRSVANLETAFATLVERQAGGLVVSAFPVAFNNRNKILALAAHHRIPAIYSQSQYAYEGGLMTYCAVGTMRQAASQYVARILKGDKPAELPIQLPTKFEFMINLKTAKVLGIEVPGLLLVAADKVIE
jgi:putative tryptophan/tyrosine transport system substrate-binding protein